MSTLGGALRKFLLPFAAVSLCLFAVGPAQAGSLAESQFELEMDDGVTLAATLYLPAGTPPQGGWPAVMLFHGLGGTRSSMDPIAKGFLANEGYTVLATTPAGTEPPAAK